MASTDCRVDEYIDRAADFARPVLIHLRKLVHKACPQVSETIKWGFPVFEYSNAILCDMAAFKNHCTFGFWLGSLMKDPYKILEAVGERNAMGNFGKITSINDLPSKETVISYIKKAMELNEQGAKRPVKKKAITSLPMHPALLAELKKNKTAHDHFEKLSPSHKNEYLEWINEAKAETTQNKRIATTVERLQHGKNRNWKYETRS